MNDIDRMIFSIYEAVGDEESWKHVLADLSKTFNSSRSLLSVEDEKSQRPYRFLTNGWEEADLKPYEEYYYSKDVWIQLLAQNNHNRFLASESVISHSNFKKTEAFNDYLKKFDIEHASGAYIGSANGLKIRVALQRDAKQGQFLSDEIAQLNTLAPHLSKAIELQNVFDQQAAQLETIQGMLDVMPYGAMITDASAVVLHSNTKAESLIANSALLSVDHHISIKDHKKGRQLHEAITHASMLLDASNASILRLDSPEHQECYTLEIKPFLLKSRFISKNTMVNGAIIFIKKNSLDDECLEKVSQNYHLTASETLIVKCLCEGKATAQIADQLSRSPYTIQTHIKNLLKKTRFTDQRQLIADVFKII